MGDHKVRLAGLLMLPLLAIAFGCGEQEDVSPPVPVFAVHGKVTVDGQPATGAMVYFHPLELSEWPRPHAMVETDGSFRLSTFREADGAPQGKYSVTLSWKVDAEHKPLVGEDRDDGAEMIPEEYLKVTTTPLNVEVVAGDNSIEAFEF